MSGKQALSIFMSAAGLPARTALAYLWHAAVGPSFILAGGMPQIVTLWANKTVLLRVICKVPGMKFVFPAGVTGIWEN